jgi:type IV pilus assembly protein PilY1
MTMESTNVDNWRWNGIIDDIGPITTSIARTQDKKNRNLWLYFGTGRYFFRNSSGLDDYSGSRSLYGIKDPCYNTTTTPGNFLDKTCTAAMTGTLVNQTNSVSTIAAGDPGWQIDLDASTTNEGAERVVTDTVALPNGTVFFTSFKPTMDICGYGGNSFLWGVKYDTGGEALAGALQGKALIQLSTGEFREVDLSTVFTDKGNRRMQAPMTGKPPSDAPPIISNSQNKPVKKILHIQEH